MRVVILRAGASVAKAVRAALASARWAALSMARYSLLVAHYIGGNASVNLNCWHSGAFSSSEVQAYRTGSQQWQSFAKVGTSDTVATSAE
jgi:hypothetical protein